MTGDLTSYFLKSFSPFNFSVSLLVSSHFLLFICMWNFFSERCLRTYVAIKLFILLGDRNILVFCCRIYDATSRRLSLKLVKQKGGGGGHWGRINFNEAFVPDTNQTQQQNYYGISFILLYIWTLQLSAYTFKIVMSSWWISPFIIMECPFSLIVILLVQKFSCFLVTKSCPTLLRPHSLCLLGSSVLGISQTRILEWVAISFSRGLPDTGIQPMSPSLALAGSFLFFLFFPVFSAATLHLWSPGHSPDTTQHMGKHRVS